MPRRPHTAHAHIGPNAQCRIRAGAHGSSLAPYASNVPLFYLRLLPVRGPKNRLRRSCKTRVLRKLRGGGSWLTLASPLS